MNQPTKLIFRFLIVCFFSLVVLVSAPDSNRYNYYEPVPQYKIVIPILDTTIIRSVWCFKSEDSVVTSASIVIEDKDFYSLLNYIDPLGKIISRNIFVYLDYDIISDSVMELDSITGISYFKFKGEDIYHYCYTGQKEALHFNKELSGKPDRIWGVDLDTTAMKIMPSFTRISYIQLMAESCILD